MELIEHSRMAIDELIDVMVRAGMEAVLELSARQVAGPPQQGKARPSQIGTQPGRVWMKERKLKVNRRALRNKGRGANKEVSILAYQAIPQNSATRERVLEILMNGVSTRRYSKVIPEMTDTVGVSRTTVSRDASPLVGGRVLGDRKVIPQDHGLPKSVGHQAILCWILASYPAGGGVESP